MEEVIKHLTDLLEKTKDQFISNSIYVHLAKPNTPVPDTTHDLELIINLKKAISILVNAPTQKE